MSEQPLLTVTQKIRHCKSCSAKCNMRDPDNVAGCECIYIPIPPLTVFGKTYGAELSSRVLFDKNHFPIDFWRAPTQEELKTFGHDMSKFHMKLAEELKKIQAEAIKHE